MTADILKNLLALQAAVHADDGDKVISTLAGILERMIAFEDGELVVSLAADLHRRKLTPADQRLALADVLTRLASHATALRIDDRDDTRHLPETHALLQEQGWRSLLAVPMSVATGVRGAVVLVARPACAFAGAPLSALGSLVTGAGLSLHHALKLSGQHDEVESLRTAVREERAAMVARVGAEAPLLGERQALAAEVTELRRELARLEGELAQCGDERAQVTTRLKEADAQKAEWKKRATMAEARGQQLEEGEPVQAAESASQPAAGASFAPEAAADPDPDPGDTSETNEDPEGTVAGDLSNSGSSTGDGAPRDTRRGRRRSRRRRK